MKPLCEFSEHSMFCSKINSAGLKQFLLNSKSVKYNAKKFKEYASNVLEYGVIRKFDSEDSYDKYFNKYGHKLKKHISHNDGYSNYYVPQFYAEIYPNGQVYLCYRYYGIRKRDINRYLLEASDCNCLICGEEASEIIRDLKATRIECLCESCATKVHLQSKGRGFTNVVTNSKMIELLKLKIGA